MIPRFVGSCSKDRNVCRLIGRGCPAREARRMVGVCDVFEIPLVHGTAVAVVADRFWIAKRARAAYDTAR